MWEGMNSLFRCRSIGLDVKRRLYGGVVVPIELYGAETWNIYIYIYIHT